MTPEALPDGGKGDQDIQQNVVLVEQNYNSLDRDGLVALVRQQQNMITWLERQVEVAQTFQAHMGLLLNKIEIEPLMDKVITMKKQTVSDGRLWDYRYAKDVFVRYCQSRGIVYADEVTQGHDYEFREFLSQQIGVRDGKLWGKYRQIHMHKAIKCAFQIAFEQNNVIRNPFKNQVSPFKPCDDWWDDDYYYKLIEAIRASHDRDKWHRPIDCRHKYEMLTRILYTTGIRIGIFCNARHERVRVTEDGRVFVTLKMKVPKSSDIQEHTYELVNKKAKEMFLVYYDPAKRGLMFGKALAPQYRQAIRGYMSRGKWYEGICEKAGIPYKNPHKAKHGYITKLLMKGYSEVQVAKLTGNLDTTVIKKVYNHIHSGDFVEKVRIDIEDL